MKETSRKKEILEKVISNLKSEKDGYCRTAHNKGWFGFLADGDLVFNTRELQQVLKRFMFVSRHPVETEKHEKRFLNV